MFLISFFLLQSNNLQNPHPKIAHSPTKIAHSPTKVAHTPLSSKHTPTKIAHTPIKVSTYFLLSKILYIFWTKPYGQIKLKYLLVLTCSSFSFSEQLSNSSGNFCFWLYCALGSHECSFPQIIVYIFFYQCSYHLTTCYYFLSVYQKNFILIPIFLFCVPKINNFLKIFHISCN